jgi:hypothetical protein
MSIDAILFARDYRSPGRGGPTCMLLLRELAARADRNEYVDSRSVRQLAEALCRDPRTVPRVVAALVADGVLTVTHRFDAKLGQIRNLYRLITEQVRRELAPRPRTPALGEVCPKCSQPMLAHYYLDLESKARGSPTCPHGP